MARKAKQIEAILFGESQMINVDTESDTSSKAAAQLNRVCDILSMWCHLYDQNDIFVTFDGNFHKATKLPRLLALGAGRVAWPEEL